MWFWRTAEQQESCRPGTICPVMVLQRRCVRSLQDLLRVQGELQSSCVKPSRKFCFLQALIFDLLVFYWSVSFASSADVCCCSAQISRACWVTVGLDNPGWILPS